MSKILGAILITLFLSTTAYAGVCEKTDEWIADKVASDSYLDRTVGMMADGLNKVLSSPKTAINETTKSIKESDNPVFGTVEGLLRGTFETASDIAEGVINFGLSIVPEFRGVGSEA